MAITKTLFGELQVILDEDYGKKVTLAEAEEIGMNLVRYFDLLAKIEYQSQPNAP